MTRLCTCPGSIASSPELSGKRNQPGEGSCKTCGGSFLVDGVGPISGTMLGTVGLEVTNSVNTELSWKTAAKGKRSRKPAARNSSGRPKLASKSPKRVGDFSGSDSDKFGETASGQPFPDRIECIPIKKRRHLLRSPSPPAQAFSDCPDSSSPQLPTPSSQSEDLEHLSDHNASSGQPSSGSNSNRRELVAGVGSSVDDGVLGDKVSGVTGGELYNMDDFSGIALLAAAACINNVDDDIENAKGDVMEVSSALQGSNTSTSPEPIRESISCSASENQIGNELPLLEHKKCSSVADYSSLAARSSDENEECKATRSVSSKVDRRHWDLNTLMEAWEEPHDAEMGNMSTVEAAIDKLDTECYGPESDSGNNNDNCENHIPLEPVDRAIESSQSKTQEKESRKFPNLESSAMDKASESSESKTQEKKSEEFSCLDGSSASEQYLHPKSPSEVVCKSESRDNFPLAESCHGSGISMSDRNMNPATGCSAVVQSEDGKIVMGSTELESSETKVAPVEVLGFEKSSLENDVHMKSAGHCQQTIEKPENRTNLNGEVSTGADSRQDAENSESTSKDDRKLFSKCEDLSTTSDISFGRQSAVSANVGNGQEEKGSADTRGTKAMIYQDSREIIYGHDDQLVSGRVEEKISKIQDSGKGSVDDSHKSDVSQDDHGHLNGGENVDELQMDYDSPYEDGELRGSVLCCWEGNEFEDGEHECVDYESDGRGGEDSDAGDYPGSEIVEAGSEGSQGTEKKSLSQIPESDSGKSGTGKGSLRKGLNDVKENIEGGGKKGSNQGSRPTDGTSTDMVVDRNDGSMRRTRSSDHMHVFDSKGSFMGEGGLKASKGKLQSRIEGPSSLDVSDRNTHQGRSRHTVGSLSRLERDSSPDRFVPRYRSAVHEHDRNGWANWESRNRYPSSYRGLENHGQTRSRSGIADSVDKFGGLNFHDDKQPISYSSKGMQRQLVRRRSPLDISRDRVDPYGGGGVHRRISGIGNQRSRGSSGNFSEGIGRGLRDEYGEPVVDDAVNSSGRMPHYLSRRDRSFSPPSRVAHVSASCQKSRSRSRTRSPRVWQSQRGNLGTRRHSRSPEFRPESRMDRMRVPFQKPSFGSDYGEGYMSPPRGGFSPQRSYRWADNRNFVDDHLRHRRSPVGVFRRSPKLDHAGFSGRLKSDNHFRRVGRPGRFPHMDGGVGRGCKMEENCEDDRRNDERSGMMQRGGRHSEGGGAILRRSRHDPEENFDAGNLNNDDDVPRSTDRRDVPRSRAVNGQGPCRTRPRSDQDPAPLHRVWDKSYTRLSRPGSGSYNASYNRAGYGTHSTGSVYPFNRL